MPRKPAAERTHEYFRKLNPGAKKHELLRWGLNQQAFLTKPVRDGNKLDIRGTISAIRRESARPWQFWKRSSINGSNIEVEKFLNRVLYPLKKHIGDNPRLASKRFAKRLNEVIGLLEERKGSGPLTTLAAGKGARADEVYSTEIHELTHRHLNDIVGRSVSTSTREGARTHEGITTFFEIYLSKLHDGKRFDDAIRQFEDRAHKELYAEPARMFHEMVAKGPVVSEENIDNAKVRKVLLQIKNGRTLDQVYRKFKEKGRI